MTTEREPEGTGTDADAPAQEAKTSWRDRLPRVPDPIRVDLPSLSPQQALAGWLFIALALTVIGLWINYSLTDGHWVLPENEVYDSSNPLGETRTQFFSTHPYDLLTASLFVGSNLLLGLSLIRRLGPTAYNIRAAGWTLFGFHWAMVAMQLYVAENGDWVNASFAIASVFVLTYFAYQELISKTLGKDNPSLRFAAGAVFLASLVWYAFLRVEVLSEWIIETVAGHTVLMLEAFGQNVAITQDGRTQFTSAIYYPEFAGRTVIIILACTAIQSMMIFVAAALAVDKADWSRRLTVIAVTVPVVYILNLLRNTIIIFLWETRWLENRLGITSDQAFGIAHNWIGKFGSLIALVFIALFVFRVLPEVVAAVVGLLDLPRRRGPLEQQWLRLRGRGNEVDETPTASDIATSAPGNEPVPTPDA